MSMERLSRSLTEVSPTDWTSLRVDVWQDPSKGLCQGASLRSMSGNLLIEDGGTSSRPFNITIKQFNVRHVLGISREYSSASFQLRAEHLNGNCTCSFWACG